MTDQSTAANASMQAAKHKLLALLTQLFQFDCEDLDFGIYRVMNARRGELRKFLDELLNKHADEILGGAGDRARLDRELSDLAARLAEDGIEDPTTSKKWRELKDRRDAQPDASVLAREVFSHLATFFSRYYDDGDFVAQARYKGDTYAIPYGGQEVHLHWANADQYYIKTSEFFENYEAMLPAFGTLVAPKLRFRLATAEQDRDNNKADDKKKRRFVFCAEKPVELAGEELTCWFEYKAVEHKQPKCSEEAATAILAAVDGQWRSLLTKKPRASDGKESERNYLEIQLYRYTEKNTRDFFIHKDLRGFLRRELDFFCKAEVVHLDDLEGLTTEQMAASLAKVKAMRALAHKVIEWLAQIEDFQKKLWLKKKFVLETSWCVTLDRVIEKAPGLLAEIAANEKQWQSWIALFAIDKKITVIGTAPSNGQAKAMKAGRKAKASKAGTLLGLDDELEDDPLVEEAVAESAETLSVVTYDAPRTVEFLRQNPGLVLDTRNFGGEFVARLHEAGVLAVVDGWAIQGENAGVLRSLGAAWAGGVEMAYADPPYNTVDEGFLYKNNYKHSTWLSMMSQVASGVAHLLPPKGVLAVTIDDAEVVDLAEMLDRSSAMTRIGILNIQAKPSGRTNDEFLSTCHEYALWYAREKEHAEITFLPLDEKQQAAYALTDNTGAFKWRDFLRTGGLSTPAERPNSCYKIWYRQSDQYIGIEAVEGAVAIDPIDSGGMMRVWRKTRPSLLAEVAAGNIAVTCDKKGVFKVRIKDYEKAGIRPKSMWYDSDMDASSHGTKPLESVLGRKQAFPYPKSVHAVERCLWLAVGASESATVVDVFAGSGTTAHAVLNLNRADSGNRRYILVEMAEYFDTVLLPRICKVVYSPDWKDGKPTTREKPISHCLCVQRFESYDDTLDNLELTAPSASTRQALLANATANEAYTLRYQLLFESKGSLLNQQQFAHPFDYQLLVRKKGVQTPVTVDLIATFNYLIGLHESSRNRYDLDGIWFIEGRLHDPNSEGQKVLVVWRDTAKVPNAKLNEWFRRGYDSVKSNQFAAIYVNGDNLLPNVRTAEDLWKVRLIEDEFLAKMFTSDEA